MKLDTVVPWGRSLTEYQRMFALSDADLEQSILDCGGGPASFNAELTARSGRVVSCDPLYQFSAEAIASRVQTTYETIVAGLHEHRDRFVWGEIATPEALGQARLASMERFLTDLPAGLAAGRYTTDALPALPFADRQFDLALCSHLLFTYSDQFSREFHQAALAELSRVAREVRVFPVLENFTGRVSPHLEPVVAQLQVQGDRVELCTVPYEFQRGGNQMLRVQA